MLPPLLAPAVAQRLGLRKSRCGLWPTSPSESCPYRRPRGPRRQIRWGQPPFAFSAWLSFRQPCEEPQSFSSQS